jgi:hypothetical protein
MGLYWVVREIEGKRLFFVQEASTQMYADLKSRVAGFEGDLKEIIPLDARAAKKLPKDLVGRVLKLGEAIRLLRKLG